MGMHEHRPYLSLDKDGLKLNGNPVEALYHTGAKLISVGCTDTTIDALEHLVKTYREKEKLTQPC